MCVCVKNLFDSLEMCVEGEVEKIIGHIEWSIIYWPRWGRWSSAVGAIKERAVKICGKKL